MSDPPSPPLELDYGTALHHFREVGEEFLLYAVRADLGGLQPDGAVLDVGCGFGRLAVPLTGYLGHDGLYEGFDIVPAGIDWGREHVSSRFPNFRFRLAHVANSMYPAPGGRRPATRVPVPLSRRAIRPGLPPLGLHAHAARRGSITTSARSSAC